MLAKRVSSGILILVFCLSIAIAGGWWFSLGIGLILCGAAWEFAEMFRVGGHQPSNTLIMLAGLLLPSVWMLNPAWVAPALAATALAAMGLHVFAFEGGRAQAGSDMGITLAGILYIGWLGSHIAALRFLPDGLAWVLLSILTVGFADVGAYGVGSLIGRHSLAPRSSPSKTFEGYLGGLGTCVLFAIAAGNVMHAWVPAITTLRAAGLGFVLGVLCPLGDLAKSVIKRQYGLKDTGQLIPGHGGVLDRIDTWLWGAPIAYYIITLLWL